VLAAHAPATAALRFMDLAEARLAGADCVVARSGYTGEDGFEISAPADAAEALAEALLADRRVAPAGLGARDTLRLEAGLCLCGQDIDETTSPVEGALGWTIGRARRPGGARAGGFPGAERILGELEEGAARRRVGLRVDGPAPVRAGAPLFESADAAAPLGHVTSGGYAPSLGEPVAMGYVPTPLSAPGTRLAAELRGRRPAVAVTELPFVPPRQKRA
jgi:aminomethyltransferase